jgi:hypothetical protein
MIWRIKGKSNKGKQRIKQHGDLWHVEEATWMTPRPSTLFMTSVKDTGTVFKGAMSGRWFNERDFDVVETGV